MAYSAKDNVVEATVAEETDVLLDLYQIRELLDLLNEKRVASWQGLGITVVFKDDDEYQSFTNSPAKPSEQVEEDGHSTSNKRVGGFRDPRLWPHQNGKTLTFDGSLE